MCPEFLTNSILMYIKSYISTTLLTFLKFVYHFAENNLPLIQQTAHSLTKIDLVETRSHGMKVLLSQRQILLVLQKLERILQHNSPFTVSLC